MYCKNCGKKIISGAKFCKHCGSEITHLNRNPENKRRLSLWPTFFISAVIVLMLIIFLGYKNGSGEINYSTGKQSKVTCNRKTPYPMAPEFQRAISLINERYQQAGFGTGKYPVYNCIDIQYADLGDTAEGYFSFDRNSKIDDLHIYVDKSYSNYDDYLTAILLSHELTHLNQLLYFLDTGQKGSCYEQEVQAYHNELNFALTLNKEEKDSLSLRLESNPYKNSAYAGFNQLLAFLNSAAYTYGVNTDNEWASIDAQIRYMVQNNPYYQKECANS